jgi:hypothetical protein
MKIGWFIVLLIWLIPACSMLACPFDLHGYSNCSSIAQFGRNISFYLVMPGLWLGSTVSHFLPREPNAGASFSAYIVSITGWLVLISAITLYLSKLLTDRASG